MNKQISTWQFILDNLKRKTASMLMYVLESNGSSPGRQGFGMAINAADEMKGSIGGGIMEHKFVEMAKAILLADDVEQESYASIKKQVHDKQAATNQSGMICSGDQTIFLYKLQPADEGHIAMLLNSMEANKNGSLVLSPKGILFSPDIPAQDYFLQIKGESDWVYIEKTGYKNHLYIAGGGHCALALCKMVSDMDFHMHLFDERANLNTMEENSFAHDKKLITDYSELKTLIPPGTNNYVLLMTFGYRTDDAAIRALLDKDFKYFGVLGSKNKIKKLFSDYIAEGISEERLNKIHAPVGLAINSQTPEEIAISIAAEIIALKNRAD